MHEPTNEVTPLRLRAPRHRLDRRAMGIHEAPHLDADDAVRFPADAAPVSPCVSC